jgi:hypothetical protein
MLYLTRKSITKGVVHFTPNAVYTLSEILIHTYVQYNRQNLRVIRYILYRERFCQKMLIKVFLRYYKANKG